MESRTLEKYSLILLLLSWFDVGLLQSANVTVNGRNKSERTVVFPVSNESEHSLPVFPDPVVAYVGRQQPMAPPVDKFGRPLCARNSRDTFCEKVENYPESEIRKAINYSSEEFVELFGTMVISSRKSGDVDEDTVCPQNSRLFYPKAAVNENDHWAYVVNDVDYVQTVMAEICQGDEEQPCRYLDGTLPSGVSSRCRQKYAYKRLLALHPNKKRTYTDAFRFPSCCVCYVKKPFVMSRTRQIDVEDKEKTFSSVRRSSLRRSRLNT